MAPKRIGTAIEELFVAKFLMEGYNVLKPVGDFLPYDLVLEINGKFIKIQVKTGRPTKLDTTVKGKRVAVRDSDKRLTFATASMKIVDGKFKTKNYNPDDFDFFAVYCPNFGTAHLIPAGVCIHKSAHAIDRSEYTSLQIRPC